MFSVLLNFLADSFALLFMMAALAFVLRNKAGLAASKNVNIGYFWMILACVLILTIQDPLERWTAGNPDLIFWRKFLSVVGYTCRAAGPLFLVLANTMNRKNRILLWIPELLNIVIMSSTFWCRAAFWYDEHYAFHRGLLGYYVFLVSGFYIIMLLRITARKYMDGQRTEAGVLAVGVIGSVIGTVLDVYFGGMRVTYSILISTIFYYMYVSAMTSIQKDNRHHGELLAAQESAQRDGLTGLYNRKAGVDLARAYVEKEIRSGEQGAFLMIDVDDFKHVNDTYGHQEGDYWLSECARILLSSVRNYDIVARYGGDEFFVLLKSINRDVAIGRMDVMLQKIRQAAKEKKRNISFSIGLCMIEAENHGFEAVLSEADDALYYAKHAGKNTFYIKAE